MIATISAPKTGYKNLVQQFLSDVATPTECLILTHSNPELISWLDDAFADQTTALLDVPQDQWQLGRGELHAAIAWAIKEGGIKHLILVGDSSAIPLVRSASHRSSDPLARARAANTYRKAVEDQFREQLIQLGESPIVGDAISAGDVRLTILFYRAEAGAFVIYDEETDSFVLLN